MKFWFCLFVLLIVCPVICPVHAYAEETWGVKAGTFAGIGVYNSGDVGVESNHKEFIIADLIVENPNEMEYFIFMPTKLWGRYVTFGGNEFNILRYNYALGQSSNFFGDVLIINEGRPYYGMTYTGKHWNSGIFDAVNLSLWHGDDFAIGVDVDYEYLPGYGIEAHCVFPFDSNGIVEINAWHNFEPDASLKFKVGYNNYMRQSVITFGPWWNW